MHQGASFGVASSHVLGGEELCVVLLIRKCLRHARRGAKARIVEGIVAFCMWFVATMAVDVNVDAMDTADSAAVGAAILSDVINCGPCAVRLQDTAVVAW